jgi:hypothetical protein
MFKTTSADTTYGSTTPFITQSPSTITNQQQPRTASFMDPLLPAVVKNTVMSVNENARKMLAQLRDVQLLKTVRAYLSYLHDHPTGCYEGLTAQHCRIIIEINSLPTDFPQLRSICETFHTSSYGFNIKDVNNDLKTLRSHISSNRINYLTRTNMKISISFIIFIKFDPV